MLEKKFVATKLERGGGENLSGRATKKDRNFFCGFP